MPELLTKLAQNGVTQEDLEKAASVRLFEKVASAQGIDLDKLTDEQVAGLYAQFESEILPTLVAGGGEGEPATVEQKIASLTEEQVFELFDKQASAEGLNPGEWTDEQLNNAFGYFLEEVLPAMAANDFEPVTVSAEKQAQIEETQAKLAEADILGRQMGRSFMDEVNKLAEMHVGEHGTKREILSAAEAAAQGEKPGVAAKGLLERLGGHAKDGIDLIKRNPIKSGLGATAALGAAGTGAYLLHRHNQNKKTASVTLTPEDVLTLSKIAESGDMDKMREAAAAIKAKSEEKEEEKGKGEESKEKKASSALDLVVQEQAVELANGWLRENGYIQG